MGRAVRHLAVSILPITLSLVACTADVSPNNTEDGDSTAGASITITPDLSGCHGHASTEIPDDGDYVMTTFGGGADTQKMSCGGTADGTGWYAASRQRYGCGAKLQIEANGKCVVVSALDYGPDVCVENAAGSPIIDLSPRAAKVLWNTSGAGWSDHLHVTVTEVDASTPVGLCTDAPPPPPPSGGGDSGNGSTTCSSATLDRDVDNGTCVQSATDGEWYECQDGAWVSKAGTSGCTESFAYCDSATLGKSVPPRTCVQSGSTGKWFQCNGQSWVSPVDVAGESGPIGDCAKMYPN